MSQLLEQVRKSQGLLSALDAITHRPAFITLFATLGLTALVLALVSAGAASLAINGHFDTAKFVGGIGALVAMATMLIGTSATGFLLNDATRGREGKTILQAVLLSVATAHRILGIWLVALVIGLVILLVTLIGIFVTKLPGVGPLLFALVYPVCIILVGVTFYAGVFVLGLHGPAVWEGNDVIRASGILGSIFRECLFSVVIQSFLLALLVGVVSLIIFGCIAVGLSVVSSMALAVLGQNVIGDFASIAQMMMGSGGNSAGYMQAGMFGLTLLMGAALTAPGLTAIAGNCIIFANVTENLDTSIMDQKMQDAMNSAREKAANTRRQLEAARAQLDSKTAPTATPTAPAAVTPVPPPFVVPSPVATVAVEADAAHACPHCTAPCEESDVFCASCGKRMR